MITRRSAFTSLTAAAIAVSPRLAHAAPSDGRIMTVRGWCEAGSLGVTLSHEHLVADIRPLSGRTTVTLDPDAVAAVVLPQLTAVKALGCRSLIDCTAVQMGRNPSVLKRLSEASGLNVVTTTGVYAAADRQFLPDYAVTETARQLADRWTGEWQNGIDDTGVRPGLIKVGINGGELTEVETKIIDAAALAHRATGLTIGAHVGPWRPTPPGYNAQSARAQIDRLETAGVDASAFIWFHAQNEKDGLTHMKAAQRGAWISYDGVAPDTVDQHVALIVQMKAAGLLDQVLVSHDAGWYSVGEPGGGTFRPFTTVFTALIPALKAGGLSDADIDTLFVRNPARAFSVRVRLRT